MALAGNVAANSEKKATMSRVNSAAAVAWTMTIYDKSADDDCRRRLRCQRLTRWKLLQWRVCGLKCPARCRCCCCAGCGCCCCCWVGATAGATSPANWFCFLFTFFVAFFIIFDFNSFRFLHTRASRLPPSKFFSCLRFVCCCYCCCCYCYCLFGFLFTGEFQQSSTALNVFSKQQQRKRDPHTEFCIS